MTTFTVVVFALVYLAMALGSVPGFKVDRAGAALIGALVLQVADVDRREGRLGAVDYQTMALMFGLMVVSAQFTMSGFYTAVTARLAAVRATPEALLAVIVVAVGALSAFLTNNVVAVAMAPLLVNACGRAEAQPGAVPAGARLRRQCRFGGDHHRQPAEHDRRPAARPALRRLHARDHRAGAVRAPRDLGRAGAPLPRAVDAGDGGGKHGRRGAATIATRRSRG